MPARAIMPECQSTLEYHSGSSTAMFHYSQLMCIHSQWVILGGMYQPIFTLYIAITASISSSHGCNISVLGSILGPQKISKIKKCIPYNLIRCVHTIYLISYMHYTYIPCPIYEMGYWIYVYELVD